MTCWGQRLLNPPLMFVNLSGTPHSLTSWLIGFNCSLLETSRGQFSYWDVYHSRGQQNVCNYSRGQFLHSTICCFPSDLYAASYVAITSLLYCLLRGTWSRIKKFELFADSQRSVALEVTSCSSPFAPVSCRVFSIAPVNPHLFSIASRIQHCSSVFSITPPQAW
jgi:hypothetical protein